MNNIRIGVATIVEEDGKILFGMRSGNHAPGTWGFIGGHLELGETFEECIRREAMEEAGVKLKNVRFEAITEDFHDSGKHYITIFMKSDIVDRTKISVQDGDTMIEWKWFPKDKLPEKMFLPIDNLIKNGYRF